MTQYAYFSNHSRTWVEVEADKVTVTDHGALVLYRRIPNVAVVHELDRYTVIAAEPPTGWTSLYIKG